MSYTINQKSVDRVSNLLDKILELVEKGHTDFIIPMYSTSLSNALYVIRQGVASAAFLKVAPYHAIKETFKFSVAPGGIRVTKKVIEAIGDFAIPPSEIVTKADEEFSEFADIVGWFVANDPKFKALTHDFNVVPSDIRSPAFLDELETFCKNGGYDYKLSEDTLSMRKIENEPKSMGS